MTAQRGEFDRPPARDASVPDPRFRDQLADVLAEHIVVSLSGVVVRCSCGWLSESRTVAGLERAREHREHVAAEVEARVLAAANQRAAEVWQALDTIGAFDGSNDEERDRAYIAAALAQPEASS